MALGRVGGLGLSRDIRKKLEQVRRVTGDKFSAKKGYDLRKPLSKRRVATIEKYYDMLIELTNRPYVEYRPKKGERKEAFEYAGQSHYPRFDRAFIHRVDPDAEMSFVLDKARPKGSRFVAFNKQSGQAFYHIPASAFVETMDEDLEAQGIDPGEHYADILRDYAEDAELFLINTGSHYMWGSPGQHESVGEKIAELFRNYSAGNFDANNPNSHYVGNWFTGVTAFTRAFDAFPLMNERMHAEAKRREERHITTDEKYRVLKSGDIGVFLRGRLIRTVRHAEIEPYAPKPKRKRQRRR